MVIRKSSLKMALIGALLLLSACDEPQSQANKQRSRPPVEARDCSDLQSKTEVKNLFLSIVDRSESFWSEGNRAEKIRGEAATAARNLEPATVILGLFISENSASDSEMFLQDTIPQLPPPIECMNPFDEKCLKEKRRHEALAVCVEEARERIAAAFENLNPPPAMRTDVGGALATASDILAAYPTTVRCVVALWSDIDDNVRSQLPAKLSGFEGVKVVVTTAGTKGPQRRAELKATLAQRLSSWGAKVVFRPLGVPLRAGEILDRRVEGP